MLIEEEEREAKARRELDMKEEMSEKNKKKKNKEALIDELVKIFCSELKSFHQNKIKKHRICMT